MMNNILFLCPSWEERSWLGFNKDCDDISINSVVAIKKKSPFNGVDIDKCVAKIKQCCNDKQIDYKELIWDDEPFHNWENLNSFLENLTINECINIDITTMPRDIIWTLLFFLTPKDSKINIRYYQPKSYNDTWLSKEPVAPRFLLKHSGIMELGKATCVVVITSFDAERTKQIVSKFEPQKVVLCVQTGQQFNNFKRNVSSVHEYICKDLGITDITSVDFNSFEEDFGETVLNNVINNLSDFNIIVASFGPKPSSIGAYMVYQKHPEIALCYVPCKEYNVNYCIGIGELYTISYK